MITKIKNLFKFLFITESDKGDHFIVGIMLGAALSGLLYNLFHKITEWPNWMSLILVSIITVGAVWITAFLKELYDEGHGGVRSVQDIKWTMIGGAIGLISISLFFI